jgi:hypothetical protein
VITLPRPIHAPNFYPNKPGLRLVPTRQGFSLRVFRPGIVVNDTYQWGSDDYDPIRRKLARTNVEFPIRTIIAMKRIAAARVSRLL